MKPNKKDRRKTESSSSSSSDTDNSESSSDSKNSRRSRDYETTAKKRKHSNHSSKEKHEDSRERSIDSEQEVSKKTKRDEHSTCKKPRNEARSSHRSREDYDKRERHRDRDGEREPERSRHSDMDKRKERNDDRMKNENTRYKKYREREESNRYDKAKNYKPNNQRERAREGEERRIQSKDGYRHKNDFVDRRRDNKYNRNRRGRSRSNSFDHVNARWGKSDEDKSKKAKGKPVEKEKPNFSLSGKLAEETNTYRGVVIKYSEPPEARKPKRRWRLYPFKGEKALQTLYIHRESAYLIGRDRKVVDLPVDHPSCSKQHGVLQYRLVSFTRDDGTTGKRVRPYLIDLESANGTFINNKKIEPKKYVELLERDVIKFGFSSREYVLLHENSKDEIQDDDVKQEEEEVKVKDEPEH